MKVAIYCRLSEEDKNKKNNVEDSKSIQNQKNMLQQYALEQGWEIFRIYSDDDYAGSDRKRPEFNRLINDAQQHKFDIVLCKTQSRFTRELELVEKYIHGLFPIWGIRFISIVDNADTANKGNKKSRQINGLVNEWYLEDMSANIRSVLTNRRKNGFHIGSFALYGYQKDPFQKGHLIIDREAAEIVKEVFVLFEQGYGKTAIARMLNDKGIPNPTEYKRLHGLRYQQPKSRNSTLWSYSAISNMLINEIYIGNMVQGKYGSVSYKTKQNKSRPKSEWYIVEGTHEPIIEKELWNKVQTLIAERAKPFGTGKIGIFSGKAHCANCGCVMRSSKSHGKHYLQCSKHRIAQDSCSGSFISVDKLERIVISELLGLFEKYLDMDQLIKNVDFSNDLEKQKKLLKNRLVILKKKTEEYSKGIQELYIDKVKNEVSEKDYKELKEKFIKERSRLQCMIMEEEIRLGEIDEKIVIGGNQREVIQQYINLEKLTRPVIEILIDHISVGKRITGTRNVPIEIYWNF